MDIQKISDIKTGSETWISEQFAKEMFTLVTGYTPRGTIQKHYEVFAIDDNTGVQPDNYGVGCLYIGNFKGCTFSAASVDFARIITAPNGLGTPELFTIKFDNSFFDFFAIVSCQTVADIVVTKAFCSFDGYLIRNEN